VVESINLDVLREKLRKYTIIVIPSKVIYTGLIFFLWNLSRKI